MIRINVITILFLMFSVQGFASQIIKEAEELVNLAKEKGIMITTAESCTGGMISSAITSISGSSAVFEYGYVTYANAAKVKLLGVNENTLKSYGAVSEEVAKEMAKGALADSDADIAVAVTGIAGPSGGTSDKPVGTVFIAIATDNQLYIEKHSFSSNRYEIRFTTTKRALEMLIEAIKTI